MNKDFFVNSLFTTIQKDGYAAIERLIGQHENLTLDCKRKANPTIGKVESSDRENLGKTLSAFANSMGGILIFGLDARKQDGDDSIKKIIPITPLNEFYSEILVAITEVIMPRYEDIQICKIECPDKPNTGVIVIQISRSERRPHRCEFGSEKGYYKRFGSTSRMMEHYEIQDAFQRSSYPFLELSYDVQSNGSMSSSSGLMLGVGISFRLNNNSHQTAHYPYLSINPHLSDAEGISYDLSDFKIRDDNAWRTFDGNVNQVIHPDDSKVIFRLSFYIKTKNNHGCLHIPDANISNFSAEMKYGCADSPIQKKIITFTINEIKRALKSHPHVVFDE